MAKLQDRTALTAPALTDYLRIDDVSDTTDDATGTSKKMLAAYAIRQYSGTSFPVANLWDGMPFIRTDINGGLLCIYEGSITSWLTAHEYSIEFPEATVSADGQTAKRWVGDTYQTYVTSFEAATYVATTNDSNSYWRMRLLSKNLSQASTSVGLSVNTSADAADTYIDNGAAADSAMTYYGWLSVDYAKQGATGTPGNLTYGATAKYRLVIP